MNHSASDEDVQALPCPFCGAAPEFSAFSVWCDNAWCGVQPDAAEQTLAESFAVWNRRAPPAGKGE